jgi:hypothetical protein
MRQKINNHNVIKFQAPFERLKLYVMSPDILLRKAIITQAIIDATNVSELRIAKKYELEAKSWIFDNCESFQTTCFECDIEPSFVRRITKELIKLHKKQSKFRDHKKN